MSETTAAAPAAAPATNPARRRGLTVIAVALAVAGLAWGGWQWVHARHYESTDNAYAAGNVVQITPQVGGTVVAIGADDTDFVRAGQVLVKLDAADARVALEQAEAQLAQTVREVRTLFANNAPLKAQVSLREADLARAQSDAARAQDDVNRRSPLLATGAVGKEEFQHATAQLAAAKSAVAAAQSAVQAAKEQLVAGQTQTEGTSPEEHPNVKRAAARVREAYLALERAQLKAPLDGTIAKRGVQLGQRVAAGAPLMTLVALNDLWVDANFKESQLKNLRIGQSAELQADVYGSKVTYHGTVAGLGAGTGAAFALLPAQNATGNWIKVVQRVPVRIALDPKEVAAHPLRVGLSMDVSVDIRNQDGKTLSDTPSTTPPQATEVFDAQLLAADAEVQAIIAANLGRKVAASARPAAAQ
ncbi:HlyD family secretion protein [Acidovorax sp. SRB_14]|uniref:efflux RND transporter periplasmic adaptor subunit n=1 Tax=unclassified Acidovorax TaxID=2684926 RepID=UPI00145CB5D1|nr:MULTISPECIES: HlyD family efflux transporter periplasmic adaptor subunit [unclassified Acidovorax]NMM76500.1 HlyD family secretion protein [Acidovorax sp. SRB_24]NMM79529.1 HlyD family secretion protein [Acidovorax sp. SRB_14]NMM90276.1 HlyD family secretion protein [Rhodococcus sp. SRB_17]